MGRAPSSHRLVFSILGSPFGAALSCCLGADATQCSVDADCPQLWSKSAAGVGTRRAGHGCHPSNTSLLVLGYVHPEQEGKGLKMRP